MTLPTMIRRVDELKAAIDALRPIDWEQEQRIMQKFRLEWNYHSNAIEGNTLTYQAQSSDAEQSKKVTE